MATIYKRKDKWQAVVRRRRHKPIYKTFTKKAVAERWAREQEQAIEEGTYHDIRAIAKTPLKHLLDLYQTQILPTRHATSHVPVASRLGTLKRYFDDLPAVATNIDAVLGFVDDRLAQVSSDAIRQELQILSDVFDTAKALWRLPVSNPVPDAKRILRKLRKLAPGVSRERRLTDDEYGSLIACKHRFPTLINQLVVYAVETGLRRGELSESRREYVDRINRIHYVPRSKTDWKTGRRGRAVPMSAAAIEVYDALPLRMDGLLFGFF